MYKYIRVYISYMSQTYATSHCYNDMDFMFITFLWRYHKKNTEKTCQIPTILNICRSRFTNKPPDTFCTTTFSLGPWVPSRPQCSAVGLGGQPLRVNVFCVQNPWRNFLKSNDQKTIKIHFFHFSWNELIFFPKFGPWRAKCAHEREDALMKGDFNYVKTWYMASMASLLVFWLCFVGL